MKTFLNRLRPLVGAEFLIPTIVRVGVLFISIQVFLRVVPKDLSVQQAVVVLMALYVALRIPVQVARTRGRRSGIPPATNVQILQNLPGRPEGQ